MMTAEDVRGVLRMKLRNRGELRRISQEHGVNLSVPMNGHQPFTPKVLRVLGYQRVKPQPYYVYRDDYDDWKALGNGRHTQEDIRAYLCKKLQKRGAKAVFADTHDIMRKYVTDFCIGKKPLHHKIAEALGLQKVQPEPYYVKEGGRDVEVQGR